MVQHKAFCPQGLQMEPYFAYVPTKRRRGNGTDLLKSLVSQHMKTPTQIHLHILKVQGQKS